MTWKSLALYRQALLEFKGLLPTKSLELLNTAILAVITEAKEEARREFRSKKLSDEEIEEIRKSDESTRALGKRFGVHYATISKIKTGKWRQGQSNVKRTPDLTETLVEA